MEHEDFNAIVSKIKKQNKNTLPTTTNGVICAGAWPVVVPEGVILPVLLAPLKISFLMKHMSVLTYPTSCTAESDLIRIKFDIFCHFKLKK